MLYIPRCTHDILKITAAYRSHEAFVVYTHNHNKKICDIRSTRYIYSYMYIPGMLRFVCAFFNFFTW